MKEVLLTVEASMAASEAGDLLAVLPYQEPDQTREVTWDYFTSIAPPRRAFFGNEDYDLDTPESEVTHG